MTVIGIERKQGLYEGNNYDNAYFHCTNPLESGKGAGLQAKSVKVKYNALSACFGKQLSEKELFAFIGKEVEFFYDEFKNVSFVQVKNPQQG